MKSNCFQGGKSCRVGSMRGELLSLSVLLKKSRESGDLFGKLFDEYILTIELLLLPLYRGAVLFGLSHIMLELMLYTIECRHDVLIEIGINE